MERNIDELAVQKQVIENSLKVKAQEIERCSQMLNDTDFNQIEALAKFHNYEIVRKVFQMLMVLNNIPPEKDIGEFMSQFDLRAFVKFCNVNMVNPEKMNAISALLQDCEGLNFETVKSFNSKFGVLFQFMLSLVRCYDLNLRYAMVLHQIEERKNLLSKSQAGSYQPEEKPKASKVSSFEYDFPGLPTKAEIPVKESFFSKDIRAKYRHKSLAPAAQVLITQSR